MSPRRVFPKIIAGYGSPPDDPARACWALFAVPLPVATVMNGRLDLVSLRCGLTTMRLDMVMLAGNELPGIY